MAMMPRSSSSNQLDLGLSLNLGLASQASISSSTTTSSSPSPWAAALHSIVGDVRRGQAQMAAAAAAEVDHHHDEQRRTSTSPDSSGSGSGNNKRELDRSGSGVDDDDGADGAGGRKKLRLSKDQAAVLEDCFKTHSTLNPKQKVALANRLGLRPRQVEVWFQNRRARTKLKQTEVDCEYLKRWCDRLADDNKRLEKEVAELRALKATPPSPTPSSAAATLTMCPSCRRVATAGAPPSNHQQQQCHPKSSAAAAAGNVLPSHCQFFPSSASAAAGAGDRSTTQSSWMNAAAPIVTRELF